MDDARDGEVGGVGMGEEAGKERKTVLSVVFEDAAGRGRGEEKVKRSG